MQQNTAVHCLSEQRLLQYVQCKQSLTSVTHEIKTIKPNQFITKFKAEESLT